MWISFLGSLLASIIAIALTLLIEKSRLPNLVNFPTFTQVSVNNKRYKSLRMSVSNRNIPWYLKLFKIPRQTAENCKATLRFYDSNEKHLFSMLGRWVSTPQIPHIPQDMIKERVFYYPEPVNILEGQKEELDVAIQREDDLVAYGCNNEAYLHNWETPSYRLPKGRYRIMIDITTQNGVISNSQFILKVNNNSGDTVLEKR